MKRRNAIVWCDFYNCNEFCEHITLENGEEISRFLVKKSENEFKWICELCKDKSLMVLNNEDKGNYVDKIDI